MYKVNLLFFKNGKTKVVKKRIDSDQLQEYLDKVNKKDFVTIKTIEPIK